MILVNTLALVAVALASVILMLTGQETDLARTTRFREASQAVSLAMGGELTARVALRRDALAAPEIDHPREAWGGVNQAPAAIRGGSFALRVTDAQGRLNLADVARGDPPASAALARIAEALAIPVETQARALLLFRQLGPEGALERLGSLGLPPETLRRLIGLVTLLPSAGPAPININAASEEMITILAASPAAAQQLIAQRQRAGFLSPTDVAAIGASLPPGTGFTSDHYWVRSEVRVGGTRQVLTSLLQRRRTPISVEVVTLARWRGAAWPAAFVG